MPMYHVFFRLRRNARFYALLLVAMSACSANEPPAPSGVDEPSAQRPRQDGADRITSPLRQEGAVCAASLPAEMLREACFHLLFDDEFDPESPLRPHRHYRVDVGSPRVRATLPSGTDFLALFVDRAPTQLRWMDAEGSVQAVEVRELESASLSDRPCPYERVYILQRPPRGEPVLSLEWSERSASFVVEDLDDLCE